ncbi:MAG: FHIPEP family type III secretion protein [Ardenticatenaceae bacterium]|nr:FHIPEP family type III secretion protein [Ardenticatenaceae bacterium]
MIEFQPHIQIELINYPPDFLPPEQPARLEFIQSIKGYAKILWENLGFISVSPQISIISPEEDHDLWGETTYYLSINGRNCPTLQIERSAARAKNMAPSVLANEIALGLFEYRSFIITAESTAQLLSLAAENYPENGWREASAKSCEQIFNRWMMLGLNMNRLLGQSFSKIVEETNQAATPLPTKLADRFVETAARSLKNYQLKAFTETATLDPFKREVQQLGQQYGTPVPSLRIETNPDIPSGFIAFQINDALLPVQSQAEDSLQFFKELLSHHLGCFQSLDLTTARLDIIAADNEPLADFFRNSDHVLDLTGVLRYLLRERIKINFSTVARGYLAINQSGADDLSPFIVFRSPVGLMSEHHGLFQVESLQLWQKADVIRTYLNREISFQFAPNNSLAVLLLDPDLEDDLRSGLTAGFSNEQQQEIIRTIWAEYRYYQNEAAAILTTMDIRAMLAEITRTAFPNLAILAYQELSPDLSIQSLARIIGD